jgi:iron complex transport system ATP-binding protein
MIEVSGLSYSVGAKQLLREANLTLEAGEVLAVVGPNGAGKSTLLKCLSGELTPSQGAITFAGRPLAAIPHHEIARMRGVLPQANRLPFAFTARELVLLGRSPHVIGRESARDHQIVQAALSSTDTLHLADRSAQTLSGGELQRVHLARVLAQIWEPPESGRLLLLDEPTSALDLKHQHALLKLACTWAAQRTAVLVILHDLSLAARYANSILWLKEGIIQTLGRPRETVTAEIIREVFEVEAKVSLSADGVPHLHILG